MSEKLKGSDAVSPWVGLKEYARPCVSQHAFKNGIWEWQGGGSWAGTLEAGGYPANFGVWLGCARNRINEK